MTVLQTICCLFIPHFLPSFGSRPHRQIQYCNSKLSRLFFFLFLVRFTCWTGLWTRRGPPTPSPRGVIYELAVCHGRTSERLPCRNPSTMSRFSSVFLQTPQHQVYSKISVFAHVLALALSQKQTVGLSSVCVRACVCVCVCVGPGDVWIFVTVDRLRHSRWAGESDGRQGGLVTLQSRAAKKKKCLKDFFGFTHFNCNRGFSI